MAKKWVKDTFAGAVDSGLLAARETETGNDWATVYDYAGSPATAGYGWMNFRTRDGAAYYEAPEHTFYTDGNTCLILPPFYDPYQTNTYEWKVSRFPADLTGWVFLPEYLLCFDSIGAIPWGGGSSVNAVRVRWDWFGKQVIVGEPAKSNPFGLANGAMLEPAAWYTPLPLLTDPDHPDTYLFKLTTKYVDGEGYRCSLTLNDVPVYEHKAFIPNVGGGTGYGDFWGGCGIGMVSGTKVAGEPGTHTLRGIAEFLDFRFNYTPVTFDTKPPLHQIARTDGRNGNAPWQLSKRRTRMWQLGGGQGK